MTDEEKAAYEQGKKDERERVYAYLLAQSMDRRPLFLPPGEYYARQIKEGEHWKEE